MRVNKHPQYLATAKTWDSKWVTSFYSHLSSPSLLLTSTSWINSLPRTFVTSSVTIGKAERLYKLHQGNLSGGEQDLQTRILQLRYSTHQWEEETKSLKDTMEFIPDNERQQRWNTVRKKTNLCYVCVSTVKGLFRKGLLTQQKLWWGQKSCTDKAECHFSPKGNSDKPGMERKILDSCLC